MIDDFNRPVFLLVATRITDPQTRQVSYSYATGNRLDASITETGASMPTDGNAEHGNADVTIRIRGEMHAIKGADRIRDHDGQEYAIEGINRDRATRETILLCTRTDAATGPGA